MMPRPKKCGDKRIYMSEQSAIASAIRCSSRRGLALRVYRCPDCRGWHLTKQVRSVV